MRLLRIFVVAAAWVCCASHATAMGNGPHPHVLYGIPKEPPRLPPGPIQPVDASSLELPLVLLLPFMGSAGVFLLGLLARALPMENRK